MRGDDDLESAFPDLSGGPKLRRRSDSGTGARAEASPPAWSDHWQAAVQEFKTKVWRRPSWQFALVLLGVGLIAGVLSWVQYLGFQSFQSVPSDLGSYNQAFFTTTHNGLFFYYTTNIPGGNGGDLFGIHFVPFFLLLAPFYAIAPGPVTLIVLKNLALAAGAIPLYGLAKYRLASRNWALLCAGVYLVSPMITSVDWNGFDPEAFLPLTVLSALYFLARQQLVRFVGAWLLALGVIETIAPLLIVFAMLGLLIDWWAHRSQPYLPLRGERRLLVVGLLLGLAWFALTYVAITQLNPVGATYGPSYGSKFSVLGAHSLPDVLPQAILHPDRAWIALNFQGGAKATYFLIALACVGFFPLVGEIRALLTGAAWGTFAVLSNAIGFYSLGTQYVGYLVPFLFVGFVSGLVVARRWATNLAPSPDSHRTSSPDPDSVRLIAVQRRAALYSPGLVLVLCVGVTVAIANPLLTQPVGATPFNTFGIGSPTSHDAGVERLLRMIPPTAGVFTTLHLFPQVSSRPNAYVLSDGAGFAGKSSYWGWVQHYINVSDYVLLDYVIDPDDSVLIQYYGNFTQYGVVGANDGTYLYERGWTGPPLVWNPTLYNFAGADLNLVNAVASAKFTTALGGSLYHVADHRVGATIWSGPHEPTLPPGVYQLTLWMRTMAPSGGNTVRLALSEQPLKVTPAVVDATPYNHHYHFDESTTTLPVLNLGRWNASSGTITGWVDSNFTVTFNYTKAGVFNEAGIELAGDMSMYLLSLSLSQLPPTG